MIYSMTGFATKTVEVPSLDNTKAYLTINVKSLNSRFFEANCKLPHSLQSLEVEIIKILKESLHRGKIYFTITLSNQLFFKKTLEPSLPVISTYLDAIDTIQKKFSIPGTIAIADIVRLPHVFIEEEAQTNTALNALIMSATHAVIQELRHEQQTEGVHLQKDILERIFIIQKEVNDIAILAEQVLQKHKLNVHLKLAELEKGSLELLEVTKHHLFAELEKMDIHEEIIRFKSHVAHLNELIQSAQEEKGRRIDFTLQELSREINTISAKSSDTSISSAVITVKVEIEKIREQAQNIV